MLARLSSHATPSRLLRLSRRFIGHPAVEPRREMDFDFVRDGPLIKTCGFTDADLTNNAPKWRQTSSWILDALKFEEERLTESARSRVYHYYLPIVMWIDRLRAQHQGPTPLTLGISAPQGCGKTTLVDCIYDVLAKMGRRAANVSIDDFYRTHADQKSIGAAYSANPLLQCRGNALTHDLPLGTDTLRKLKGLTGTGTVAIPRYDKSAFGGEGDRKSEEDWMRVEGPLDVILFEGWMLGFRPSTADHVQSISPHLLPINEALKSYAPAWDAHVDAWLVIKVADPTWVRKWRLEAEHAMKRSGKAGMSDAAIEAFVNCYMPAYKAYLPELYSKGPTTALPNKCLIVEVDAQRSPIVEQPKQIG